MYLIATFKQDPLVELAIQELIASGFTRSHIMAVPLRCRKSGRRLIDTIHYADGYSSMDLPAILGTICMLLGSMYGYVLEWGPILWAVIGLFSGFAVGLLGKLWIMRGRFSMPRRLSEVVLIIHCKEERQHEAENILWEHAALAVSHVRSGGDPIGRAQEQAGQ